MHSTCVLLGLALFGSASLSLVFTGCSGPQMQQTDVDGAWAPSQPPTSIGERQLDPLLVKLSQLQMVSQESLDAAKLVGTPDQGLMRRGKTMRRLSNGYRMAKRHTRPSNMSSVGTDCERLMRPFDVLKRLRYALVLDSLNTSWQRITGAS